MNAPREEASWGEVLDFASFTREVECPPVLPDESWRPVPVRIGPSEVSAFLSFCRGRQIGVRDAIDRQLADLAAVKYPSAGAAEERERFVATVAATGERVAYGTWMFFPWESRIVHLLDRDDYYEVITNRNHDKITRTEQAALRTKCVGVIGLSVGGEAAVTIAQEHLCATLVIGDLDRLDLSNLNRLNAGCDELGVMKTTIVARRVAKIDPYLRVVTFPEGVQSDNIASFVEGLDLLVDECDSLTLKRDIRLEARRRKLNIVYAGDERGFLSIEPHAYAGGLAAFHGRDIDQDKPKEHYASPLDFMRALANWLGGWSALSARSRASLERVGQDLCGYPQLASEARFAAGQLGHVARRLLLGERLSPLLTHIDLEQLLPMSAVRPG